MQKWYSIKRFPCAYFMVLMCNSVVLVEIKSSKSMQNVNFLKQKYDLNSNEYLVGGIYEQFVQNVISAQFTGFIFLWLCLQFYCVGSASW